MPNRNDSWGIEVGANAIKALRLVRKKGQILVADYEIIPFKKILTTPDINVDEAIQVNLDQFLSRHSVAKSTVMISVPGHMAFARFAKLPPVDPKKIPDIVKFEAVQQIPFPIEQVEWDYQIFSRPDSPDVEVGIVAITRERVLQFLNNYYSVGLAVDGLTLSPMAVYNAMAYEMDLTNESPGAIFLDIGTSATDVVIVENGQLWIRPLPIGGNNFTEALVRAFKLSFPKAERLKREAGTSKYARQIFQAMRPVFADLVQEVQRTLGHYQTVYRDSKLTRMVCLGSTFRLPGMQKFLKQQLQLEVIRPDGFKKIKVDDKEEAVFAENALNLATAYGLALQGLELEKVSVNILPRKIIRQRLWREKGLWFGAAAGLMVGATVLSGYELWKSQSDWKAANELAEKVIVPTSALATKNITEWNEVSGKANPTQQIENLRGVLDYRDVWPKIMLDLDLAAKSLRPQKELLDSPADYAAIRKVARGERRKVIIESVTSSYQFVKVAPPKAPAGAPAPAAAAPAPAAGAPAAGATSAAGFKPWGTEASPTFVIDVRGTTTFENAPEVIAAAYVKWLQNNAERPDRPYRIYAGPESLVQIDRKADEASLLGINSSGTVNTPGATPAKPVIQLTPVYPVRPTAAEGAERDWRFQFTWRVQLVRPEDVKKSEEAQIAAEAAKVAGAPGSSAPGASGAPATPPGGAKAVPASAPAGAPKAPAPAPAPPRGPASRGPSAPVTEEQS